MLFQFGDDTYRFDPPSNTSFGEDYLIRDPYESETVRVGNSGAPDSGDGLFATRNIRAG